MSRRKLKSSKSLVLSSFILFLILIGSFYKDEIEMLLLNITKANEVTSYELENIPEYSDEPYVVINTNKPNFSEEELKIKSLESYSELDILGRCGVAFALIGKETMPTTKRESIGMIKPSGWQTIKYDIVDGKYLYNRCHLIGFQLAGENDNPNNLITCTRQTNAETMLYFENQVASYVKNTGNHVLYRVTPIFKDNELVARGIQIEALSVEDDGRGISFNVYIYNVQDGIEIDYKTGNSELKGV